MFRYIYKPADGCKEGEKTCKCKADQTCNSDALECFQGVCLVPNCNGDLNCTCANGKCFTPYVCALIGDNNSGICTEEPEVDPTITGASAISLAVGAAAVAVGAAWC